MRADYENWLRRNEYAASAGNRLAQARRVEQHFGDIDQHYANDRLKAVMRALAYSTEDERRGRPNPTPIPINGILRTNLASYRNALKLYGTFRESHVAEVGGATIAAQAEPPIPRANLANGKTSRPPVPVEHARTLAEFGFDGQAALRLQTPSEPEREERGEGYGG